MKLEVGKRYVMRNGEVVGPLTDYGGGDFQFTDANAKDNFGRQFSWRIDGSEQLDRRQSKYDIVSEYSEPDPSHDVQHSLRWVENCKPDKPGIWAQLYDEGNAIHVEEWSVEDVTYHATPGTRCYLGPIPEILPPVKKVVERLWLEPTDVPAITGCKTFIERWFADGASDTQINDWIRTDRTCEREI